MNRLKIVDFIIRQIKKLAYPKKLIKAGIRKIFPGIIIFLHYPLHSKPRWTFAKPHQKLYSIINQGRASYERLLKSFLNYSEYFKKIKLRQARHSSLSSPCWLNGWFPPLDGIALYSLMVMKRPKRYMEIGYGVSTKFAYQAKVDHRLETKIISIDPHPREKIDRICDECIRKPVEDVSPEVFDVLGENDILLIDGAHRTFMNSDVTAIFLDVIPRLKPGVLVQFHDIMLPYDYLAEMAGDFYSEQYLLAAYLLGGGGRFDIVLPNLFITRDPELISILNPVWEMPNMQKAPRYGSSFWVKIRN